MTKRKDDLKAVTKKQLEQLRHATRKDPKHVVHKLIGRPPSPKKPTRRPSTKTLASVYWWMRAQGLRVYGPAADLEKGTVDPFGNQDYTVSDMLQLAQLNKRYPEGIPQSEPELDNENEG